jgi:ADP-ribose pyrophosphatase YjhB (NUDIX family)
MSIRSTSKAIVISNEKVLLNRCFDNKNGEYYSLPGGGQNKFETMQDAVVREVLEETGYTVKPIRFGALCEEICDDNEFREKYPEYAHKMLHIFVCELVGSPKLTPTETDDFQVAIEWIPIEQLNKIRILPEMVGENIKDIIKSKTPLFLGSKHIQFNHG